MYAGVHRSVCTSSFASFHHVMRTLLVTASFIAYVLNFKRKVIFLIPNTD